ncbi:hypothetical protein ACNF40_06590 [Cuniculiplasma sp. SKW4]|uniref:hypothetical protein n=1 Tax=Cuniculiplasma sp. SKW4 TaxID=3400171 RepID=UPI003FD5FB79
MNSSKCSDFIALFGVVLFYSLTWISLAILGLKMFLISPDIGMFSILVLMPIVFLVLGMKFRQILDFFRKERNVEVIA